MVNEYASTDEALPALGAVPFCHFTVVVAPSIKNEVIKKLKIRLETLIVGDPMDKNTDIGAINSKEQLKTINDYIKIGEQEGLEKFQYTYNSVDYIWEHVNESLNGDSAILEVLEHLIHTITVYGLSENDALNQQNQMIIKYFFDSFNGIRSENCGKTVWKDSPRC